MTDENEPKSEYNPLTAFIAQVEKDNEVSITARDFIQLFNAYRRSSRNSANIQNEILKNGWYVEPNFLEVHIDNLITVSKKGMTHGAGLPNEEPAEVASESLMSDQVKGANETSFSLRRILSDEKPLVFVSPQDSVTKAITLMMQYGYSQLPVIKTGKRIVEGKITWESIARRLFNAKDKDESISKYLEKAEVVSIDDSLFYVIPKIVEHECVIVKNTDQTCVHILTAADVAQKFEQLGEPFILLEQIEGIIREILSILKPEMLKNIKDPNDTKRNIEDIYDLTFGEYKRLFEDSECWEILNLNIDKDIWINKLDDIREKRNDIMHFNSDPNKPEDIAVLRDFLRFLLKLRNIRESNRLQPMPLAPHQLLL